MNQPLITIITVVLNDEKNIEKTIKSVINQKDVKFEYIIIDGGSTDNTIKILSKYKKSIKKIISKKDKGIYDAMNKGVIQATGDYICFVNGGDFLYENSLISVNKLFSVQKNRFFFSVADIDYVDHKNKVVGSKICRSSEQIIKRKFIEMPTNHIGIFVPVESLKKKRLI